MKKEMSMIFVLLLSVAVLLPSLTANASSKDILRNYNYRDLGRRTTELRYSETIGYYLAQEIEQGLEFTILGKGNYVVIRDNVDGEYYLMDNLNLERFVIESSERFEIIPSKRSDESSYYNPTTPISKMYGVQLLEGVWWGGIVEDFYVSGAVASVTIATTSSAQSKASVKPGALASWVSSGWSNNNEVAEIMREVGLFGNKAAWDLRIN